MVHNLYPDIQNRFSLLNNQYNVGCTQFEMRYKSANKPVIVAAFKPDEEIDKFKNSGIIDETLINTFKEHKLL